MNYSRFLLVYLHVLHVLFMHISLVQVHAFKPETGNVTVRCIETERQALLSLKRGFEQNNNWTSSWQKGWLSSWGDGENQKECCNWQGIQCSDETGHVLKLDLHSDDYVTVTTISPSLGELHYLNYLDLSYIDVVQKPSTVDFIGSLTSLRYLDLSNSGNFLGEIPIDLGDLLFLEYLDLRESALEGKIPSQLSNLSHLVHLDLGNNGLEGPIPPQFAYLSNLVYLDLSWNNLDGKIPLQVTHLSSMRYMNLRANEFNGSLPPSLGNLLSLEYLDLSENNFIGPIPRHFRNLSNLQYLDLSDIDRSYLSSDLQWLSHLSSLRHLSLFSVNLSSAKSWQWIVSGLSHLRYLDLHGCNLLDFSILSPLSPTANFSTSLSFVDISYNHLTKPSMIFPWLMNSSSSLTTLRMNNNSLKGTVPEAFGDLSSLEELNLANNMLNGQIPVSLFHSCNLRELDLSNNRLRGQFHEFVQALSRCTHKPSLQTLNIGWNEITGVVPNLSNLTSLRVLLLDNNKLSGTIHEGIGQLSHLVQLSLPNNKLEGLISEAHFLRLYNLSTLDLSFNALVFNVSNEWIPPFSLKDINLASCILGPTFPRWFQTQKYIEFLDISLAEISGTVPNWFWELLPSMTKLNLSHNYMSGVIDNLPLEIGMINFEIDLSSNSFEGSVPEFLSLSTQVYLSHNKFSTANLLLCTNNYKAIKFLDLSNNYMRGELPDCWTHFGSLVILDLSENYFVGNIPRSLGSLRDIQSLHLGGNKFSGEIPLSLMNCTKLEVFVAAENHLSGLFPSWIGEKLPKLLVLSLYSNKFHGNMPLSICSFKELRVLDLSLNDLSGKIPKCISNLSSMATQANLNATISHGYHVYGSRSYVGSGVYADSVSVIWKGKLSKYGSTLGLLRSIDFSSNRLVGEIPSDIMNLVGLVSLNMSRNMLSGEIPPTIGQLRSLDFLDLSRNQLSGRIPSQLSQLDRLSVLDLSYNDLSGEIPHGTQLQARDASSYIGNPELCGRPLNRTCPIQGDQVEDENDAHVDDEQFVTKGFYITIAIGFVTGFWGVCFSLILNKSLRYAYFKFWSDAYNKLYVLAAIKIAQKQRI